MTGATQVEPRHTGIAAPHRRRPLIAVVAIVVAVGFVVFKGLGNATVYFREADAAVAQRAELGTRRFRIEGIVLDGSIRRTGNDTRFTIEQNSVDVAVVHQGDPPELFQPNIPVVLEGRFTSTTGPAVFRSDRILVKHTNQYRQKNPDRVTDYTTPAS